MKALPLALLVVACFTARTAVAREHDARSLTVSLSGMDSPARWGDRHDPREARSVLVSRDGDAMLLVTDRVLALELTDRAVHQLRRDLSQRQDERDRQDNPLARAIGSAVISGVGNALSQSAEYPLRELRDAEWRDGRLVLTGEDGQRVFAGISLRKQEVLADFAENDAREFVRDLRRAMRHAL